MNRPSLREVLLLAMLAMLAMSSGEAEAGLVLTANAAGSQASSVANITTETFDSFATKTYTSLTTAVGTLSSPGLAIVAENQYGGAGGTGKYAAIGAESGQTTATLTLNGPQAYFGFWWSAADAQNVIEFFSNGAEIGSFNPTTALGALGTSYNGNPNGGDSSEKFAYLNIFGTAGTTFDQVVFLNMNTQTGFESDNWSVEAAQVNSPLPGTVIGGVAAVPEPSSLALCFIAGACSLGVAGIRRGRAAG